MLATTTPYDLVKPLADRLGLDDVVATRYGVDADGTYDGTLVGPFVWAAGKLEAVRAWAAEHGVDLAESYAYSDSFYDAPLLSRRRHPGRRQPRPPDGAAGDGAAVADPQPRRVAGRGEDPGARHRAAAARPAVLAARADAVRQVRHRGRRAHPGRAGAAILVANHRSYFDPLAMSVAIARSGRTVRFLGKKEVFDAPIVGQLATAMGGIRVDRGTGSDEPLQAAADALAGGEVVAIMPQGTIPRGPAFFDPELKGRWGAARLAELTKAPVIPIGLWGTERVWPRSSRLPNVLNVTDPPRCGSGRRAGRAEVPVARRRHQADHVGDHRPAPGRGPRRRTPTADELAATYPPGYQG